MKTNPALAKEIIRSENLGHLTRTVKLAELSEAAVALLVAHQRQTWGHDRLFVTPTGDVSITFFDVHSSDDEIAIRLKSTITLPERMMLYGVEGLQNEDKERDSDGRLTYRKGLGGFYAFIPCERYVREVVAAYGEVDQARRWYIPRTISGLLQNGKITGAEALEAAALSLSRFCESGKFSIA